MTAKKKAEKDVLTKWHGEITKVITDLESTSRIGRQQRFQLYQMGLLGIAIALGDKVPSEVLACMIGGRELKDK